MANLGKLLTDLGERSAYDAASQCSRCGYCEQSCPTYKATGDEKQSPRGRNQLVRLMIEGKLQDKRAAAEALDSCLLCSGCSTTCYAHVPTADIVLEGRRLLERPVHPLVRALTRLLLDRPALFALLLKAANVGKRLGLARLARPFLPRALAEADSHVDRAPLKFSHEILEKNGEALQFQPCGTRYLFTEVAQATQKALGGSTPMRAGCCGLLAYNYGELNEAREFARRAVSSADGNAPIAVDCSSCAAHMKSYEQLFLDDPAWREKAKTFASRVRDAAELFSQVEPPAGAARYHESCRACHGQGLKAPAGIAPLDPAKDCCGGAGAFSFLHPELSEELLKKKIELVKAAGATTIVTSSTSCLIQLAAGLRKYYPSCAVRHVSEIAASSDRT